jgi:dienelactone hydrolase
MSISANEPLGLARRDSAPLTSHPDVRASRFVFSSRGARVPGRLLLPPSHREPLPLVILQHGAGGSKDAPYMDATAGPWAQRGLAVASIDFPLHGERGNAKLSGLLGAELARQGPGEGGADLAREFAEQALTDLARGLDAVAELAELDSNRLGYAGFSLGAMIGAAFCARDPRPRAAALALGGGGFGPPELDPAQHIAAFAPRPLLLVNVTGDETVPRAAAEALFEAAGEPKQQQWFDGTHTSLPGAALKAMWLFFQRQLELGGSS